jgi:hypothetical protein
VHFGGGAYKFAIFHIDVDEVGMGAEWALGPVGKHPFIPIFIPHSLAFGAVERLRHLFSSVA